MRYSSQRCCGTNTELGASLSQDPSHLQFHYKTTDWLTLMANRIAVYTSSLRHSFTSRSVFWRNLLSLTFRLKNEFYRFYLNTAEHSENSKATWWIFEIHGELQLAVVFDWSTWRSYKSLCSPWYWHHKDFFSCNICYGLIMLWMEFWYNSAFWINPLWW